MNPTSLGPVALTVVLDDWLPRLLKEAGYHVITTTSGLEARELALQTIPDIVVVEPVIDDMSGTEACRLLRSDPQFERHLPILIVTDGPPTPELRVAALRVGAWDFISRSLGDKEVLFKVATFIEAKRTVGEAVDDGLLDPASGFASLPGLARRARELSALMTRISGPLACVILEVEGRPTIRDLGGVVARTARLSDVVGDLGYSRMGILAPGTNGPGAVRLAKRVSESITDVVRSRLGDDHPASSPTIVAGYDVVVNAKYTPTDPFDLLQRAASAVRHGLPTTELPWIRRFADSTMMERRIPPGSSDAPNQNRRSAEGVHR